MILPSLPIMLSTSIDTRTGVVTAFGEQHQRRLQAVLLSKFLLHGPRRAAGPSQRQGPLPMSRASPPVDPSPRTIHLAELCLGSIERESVLRTVALFGLQISRTR